MARADTSYPLLRERHRQANLDALVAVFADQAEDVAARHEAGAAVLLAKRWDAVLRDVILDRNAATAREVAFRVAAALGSDYDPAIMDAWLAANAQITAELINDATRERLADTTSEEEVTAVMDTLQTSGAERSAIDMVTAIAGFAARDVATHTDGAVKQWRVNSTDPRSSHSRMNGETVPAGQRFSNRMDWPGDYSGGADDVANCRCSLTILT